MLKRCATLFLILLLTLPLAVSGLAAPAEEVTVLEIVTPRGRLNIRKSPQENADVAEKLANHSFVKKLEKRDGFIRVMWGKDREGWAAGEFLRETPYGEDVLSYRALQAGMKGESVTALKERLLALGYYKANARVSETYNAVCAQRVKLFQKVNGLEETGIATPSVQALMFSENARRNDQPLPAPVRRVIIGGRHSGVDTGDSFDWDKFAREHPGVCMCCMGKGCECCNFTGRIN